MDALQAATSTQGATDVFSLSDQVLSDRLQFVEEIGFGNWGSVWLCRPKSKRPESSKKSLLQDQIAVKLVHRSDKTPTTAARVKSLWNEMKIIRSFKTDTHPAIIPFHSFIITPSYALITMTYHPTLVPVEVDELKAREWFRFLLSGVEFLHRRGVVHNDIKPANILVSENNVPVLVDFGFAEKYESGSPKSFQSNLSYGTPEYLAPERARGLPHDTRKSDVWSLGVSFFEILMGRTPFEYSDTDQCSTKEELERYWKRTLSGDWLGTWKMTPGMERLLRRMIAPNSELRCTAVQAMNDPYWQYRKEMRGTHRTSSSYGSSIVFEKDLAKLMLIDQPPMPSRLPTTAEVPSTPPGLSPAKRLSSDKDNKKDSPLLAKPKSPTKIAPPVTPRIQPRKRIATGATTPIRPKTSPATPSSSVAGNSGKENIRSFLVNPSNVSTPTRKPHVPGGRENLVPRSAPRPATAGADVKERRRSRVLGEVSVNVNRTRDYKSKDSLRKDGRTSPAALVKKEVKKEPSLTSDKTKTSGSDSVRNRVKEWERERQRLREMARLELEETSEEEEEEEEEDKESEKEDDVKEAVKVEETIEEEKEELAVVEEEEPRRVSGMSTPALSRSNTSAKTSDSPKTPPLSTQAPAIVIRGSKPNARPSTEDHEVDVYKSSPAQVTNKATPAVWLAASPKADKRRSGQGRDSWASDILGDKTSSPLSTILKAKSNERSVAAAKKDRMDAWMRGIEPVMEDHQSSFTSSSAHDILPSLPVPPPRSASRYPSSRSSRNPRKILSASQIFNSDGGPGGTDTPDTSVAGVDTSLVSTPSKGSMLPAVPEVSTPVRRRATVSTSSPCKLSGGPSEQETPADSPSPSKRREKSKSYGNLLQLRIAPIAELEAEINKPVVPNSSRRLSDVVDSSLFIAPPRSPPPVDFDDDDDQDFSTMEYPSFNDLTSSPIIVESQSKRQTKPVLPDTPSQKRLEGVYDRFRLATSGVRRLGKGYQNDMSTPAMPPSSTPQAVSANGRKIPSRRPAAPPVALKNFKFDSSTHRRTVSAAELGMMSCPAAGAAGETRAKDDSKITVGLMKRAFKAMVPGKTSSKRLSRAA